MATETNRLPISAKEAILTTGRLFHEILDKVISPKEAESILTLDYKLPKDFWDQAMVENSNGFHIPQILISLARNQQPPNKTISQIVHDEYMKRFYQINET